MGLNLEQRRSILDNVLATIDKRFMGPDVEVSELRRRYEGPILSAAEDEPFEEAVTALLKTLGVSHTGFFHEAKPRAAARAAIAATFTKGETADGPRWVFQDVHPGGAAAGAGVRPGDVLLSVQGRDLVPPAATPFTLGERFEVVLRRPDGSTISPTLHVPSPKNKRQPVIVPDQVVTASRLGNGVGYLRVSMFPGILGMDVARDMTRAVEELSCERLIVDLRGNTGGGIGCLRLMSLLCPDRQGTGYSIDRARARKGFVKEQLPAFDRIPRSKLGVVPLMVRFARAGRSVAVYTEGLGPRRHHGRVAILVNEHTASAAEMVAAFGQEGGGAKLVGARTAGRLVAMSTFKVGFGYRVALPVAAYYTWLGTNLEGRGVEPHVAANRSMQELWAGRDTQLEQARALVDAL
jgi:carboxyl-terminal processing protease